LTFEPFCTQQATNPLRRHIRSNPTADYTLTAHLKSNQTDPAQFFGAIEPLHGLHIAVLVNVQIKQTAFPLRAAKSKPNSQLQYRAKKYLCKNLFIKTKILHLSYPNILIRFL
jgi:hypothetical protein